MPPKKQSKSDNGNGEMRRTPSRPMIQPINTGTILSKVSFDEKLIGRAPSSRAVNSDMYDGLVTISAFLRRHQFLSSATSTNSEARVYRPVMAEFTKAQMERQATGLRTNTSAADGATMKKIVDSHNDALRYALDTVAEQDSWLTSIGAHTKGVHSRLCPDVEFSGSYRENKVRAGNSLFPLPENISDGK